MLNLLSFAPFVSFAVLEYIILLPPTLLITHHFFKRFHKKSSFFLKLFAQFKKNV